MNIYHLKTMTGSLTFLMEYKYKVGKGGGMNKWMK
jgi:hypothetical protein